MTESVTECGDESQGCCPESNGITISSLNEVSSQLERKSDMPGDSESQLHSSRIRDPDIVWPRKVDLFGMGVSVTDYRQATSVIMQAASQRIGALVSCHAVHAVVTLTSSDPMRRMANDFHMITPDGQPVRWALNMLHGVGMRDRVYGPELMLQICDAASGQGQAIYLYGGTEDVLGKLQQKLCAQFPGLMIAGSESPPFRPLDEAEENEVVQRINDSGASIVFIGLGCPKQDVFAHRVKGRVRAVQVCVGAAFDFHAGIKPMAPKWMQSRGLEWLFRLYQEPRRLWKRYLATNSVFVFRLAVSMFRNYSQRGA